MNNQFLHKIIFLSLILFVISSNSYASNCDVDDFHSYILLDNSSSMGTARLSDAKKSVDIYLKTLGNMSITCVNLYIANIDEYYIGKYIEGELSLKLNKVRSNGTNPLPYLARFKENLIHYRCDQFIIVTDGDDGAGDEAIYELKRISKMCDQVGIVGVYLDNNSDLNRIASQSGSTFCNGTNYHDISDCLIKNLTPFYFNENTKVCENKNGNQGYNNVNLNQDQNNFDCYDFRNIDLNESKWKKLFNLNQSGNLKSFKGSLFNGLEFNFMQLRGTLTHANFTDTIFNNSMIVTNNLSHSSFLNAKFEKSTIKISEQASRKLSFCNSDLENFQIKNSKFINITFCNQDFSYLDIKDSQFYYINWKNSSFRSTNFIRSKIVKSSITSSAVESSLFQGSLEIEFKKTIINDSNITGNGTITLEGKGIVDSSSEGHINYNFMDAQLTSLDFSKVYGQTKISSSTINKLKFNNTYNHLDLTLKNSTCNYCDFDNSNIKSLSVNNSILKESSFVNSKIKNALIKNTTLTSVVFNNSSLPYAKLINIKLNASTFTNSLDGTQTINGLKADHASFENSIFQDLKGDIKLNEMTFKNAHFKKTIGLDKLSITNTIFNNTKIEALVLSNAYLSNIIFNENIVNISCSYCEIKNVKFNTDHSLGLIHTKMSETQIDTRHCIHDFRNSDINNSLLKCDRYDLKLERTTAKNSTISSKLLQLSLVGSTMKNTLLENSNIQLKIQSSSILDSSFQNNNIQDYAQIIDSNIKDVKFFKNNFSNLTISKSTIENSDFNNTRFSNLTKIDFTSFKNSHNLNNGKNIFKVSFTDVKPSNNLFNGSNFGLSTFLDCDFSNINLKNINFSSSKITNTYFDNSNLNNISFSSTEIKDSSFINSKIHNSRFNTITVVDSILTEMKIKNSNFIQFTHFKNPNLNNSEFESNFIGDLKIINSTAKELYFIDNNLINAQFEDTILEGSYAIGTQIDRAKFKGTSKRDDIISD